MCPKKGPNKGTSEYGLTDNDKIIVRSKAFKGDPPTRVKCLESRIALGNADGDNFISDLAAVCIC